jgi:hypothetical protein
LPPIANLPLSCFAFITGRIRLPDAGSSILSNLVNRVGIAPFFLAHDNEHIILGTLASEAQRTVARPAVLDTLRHHMTDIEVFREPLRSLAADIDYRFDRLR